MAASAGCAHGVAEWSDRGATIFPQPLGLAATFDKQLMLAVASAMGDEARAKANAMWRREGRTG
jgi:beta-glucosidase